ncbi:MAG: LysE family transporter [Deltaproteobacteria bacterium]|jgi:threonine/homoserine/homoserine lactone efflux protein|nr:LysE family transporter [Deltaproteobacteria bacterium]
MDISFFVRGIIIGFAIAAPVGPIGVLCIQRTLNRGASFGFVSGLGAATADACYGIIAAFSVATVFNFLSAQKVWFSLAGGLYLGYLGIKAFRTVPDSEIEAANNMGRLSAYLSIFFLTLTNPMTIFAFAAVFAGFGFGNTDGNYLNAVILVIGVFTGSALWWLTLSGITGLIRRKFSPTHLVWVNRISGGVILGFAAYIVWGLL